MQDQNRYSSSPDPEVDRLLREADELLGQGPAPRACNGDPARPSPLAYNSDPTAPSYEAFHPAPGAAYGGEPYPPVYDGQPNAYGYPYQEEPGPNAREKAPRPPKRRRKKRHIFRKVLLLLLLAVILIPVIWYFTAVRPPESSASLGTRKKDCATVLLCGTDNDGTRTDTMMLLKVDKSAKELTLVSLPRDTLTRTAAGDYAKLNSAYGRNGCGQEGMEALLDYVAEIVGFRPDGYMLIALDGFMEIVDLMGGVDFEVPQDMYYEDASQDLYIDLQEGLQHLDGYAAMCLARFRSGYAMQDLGRVDVQRQLLSACLKQWVKPGNVLKLGKLLNVLGDCTISDLSTGNLAWLGLGAWQCGLGTLETATLPGTARTVDGMSCYVLDPEGVADMVNELLNPYETPITVKDLHIAD